MTDRFQNEVSQSTSRINEGKVKRILTNDRGRIKFEGCDEELGLRNYIRVNDDGNKEGPGSLDEVLKSLMTEWDLKTPNLLISVTGGAKSFQVKTQQRTAFRRGLIKLARTTDPWIISGGSNTGIMKEVGEAVRDFNLTANCGQSIVAIGIATWGVVQNREHLRNGLGSKNEIENTNKASPGVADFNDPPKSYKLERVANRNETFLNPNHTHFILVDDGTEHTFGKEITFRAEIENAVANLKTDTGKDAVSVPVVLLVVEGGPNTIETVLNAVCKNTPTVVVKGSGKAADIIAYAYEQAREIIEHGKESARGRPVSVFDGPLKSKIRAMVEEEAWINVVIKDVCKNVEMCVKDRNLITVFDITAITSEMSQGIDIAILKALMKVKRDNSLSQLKLALCWNRIDIANSEIMRDMSRQSLETALADNDMIMSALGLDRVDFMDLFLDNGVDINAFLTARRLKQLYHQVSANSILRTILRKSQKNFDINADDCLVKVGELINILLGEFYEVLAVYQKPEERRSSQSLNQQSDATFPRQESSNGVEHKAWGKSQNQVSQNENDFASKTIMDGNGLDKKAVSPSHFFQNKIEVDTKVVSSTKKPSPRLLSMKSAVRNLVSVKGTLEEIHKFENPNLHLFLWCVLTNRQEMAKLFWKYGKDHIAAALVAHGLLKQMSSLIGDKESEKILRQNSDEFCQLAVNILNECQEKDEKKATDLLTQRMEEWGHTTCEQIAMKTDNKHFVAHATFQSLLSSMWKGELSPLNGLTWTLVCIVPLLQPLIWRKIRFKVDDQREQIQSKQIKCENAAIGDNSVKELTNDLTEELPKVSKLKKIQHFYQAPVVKFVQNFVSYVFFLMLFSYALLSKFDNTLTGVEMTLFVWVFSLLAEEANQFFSSKGNYFLNKLNVLDLLPIVLFLVGAICLVGSGSVPLEVGRIFFSFSFIGFFLRLLGLFSVHKDLGPKLVMITKMFVDLIYFLAILMVFVVSYSIAAHSILYPVSRFDGDLLFNLLRIPYWNLYGELILDEMEIKEPECSFDPLLYENDTLPRCPTQIGGYVVPILMGFYMMIANILLLNLLIAMFSNTFQKVQENSDLYWCFQRFTLIYDYSCRPVLPPPLILVCHTWKLLNWCYWKYRQVCKCARTCCRDCSYKDTTIFGDVCDKEASLTQWEKIVADEYLYRVSHTTTDTGSDKTRKKTAAEENTSNHDTKIDIKLDALLAKQEEMCTNQMTKTTNEETKTEDFIKVKKSKLHFLSRVCVYPSTAVARFPVPDNLVSWKTKYQDYNPKVIDKNNPETSVAETDMKKAEPSRSMLLQSSKSLSFNEYDQEYTVDRRSVLGKYKVVGRIPRNPIGRTGVIGRGCLAVWGPNHEKRLIITRWAADAAGKQMLRKGKRLFQFLSWKRALDGHWTIYPEHTTETIDSSAVKEFIPNVSVKPTDILDSIFQKSQEVYLGYVDSPLNTDNAWVEVTIKTYMDENQSLQQYSYLNNFIFREDNSLHVAVWKTASSRDMNGTEQYQCLKSIAKNLRASF
ncbi:transient receptor potential cation channel subfamily M member-like 2 [Ylistrum balloti]|uniref:transient receptor potential cation channel subfamily M member-like 2 n=1 Tax=Ylistrum balloti TaxID=509963 RepID=UPI002905C1CB|nr:transient receptor potential cation channel subfamily M member-like 2 [Ylistrum balloti]